MWGRYCNSLRCATIMVKNRTPCVCVMILYPSSRIDVVIYRLLPVICARWTDSCKIPRKRIKSFLDSQKQWTQTLLSRSMACSRTLITLSVCNHWSYLRFVGVCCKGHVSKPLWSFYHSLEVIVFGGSVHLVLCLKYWTPSRVHMGKWWGSYHTRNRGRLKPRILIF